MDGGIAIHGVTAPGTQGASQNFSFGGVTGMQGQMSGMKLFLIVAFGVFLGGLVALLVWTFIMLQLIEQQLQDFIQHMESHSWVFYM